MSRLSQSSYTVVFAAIVCVVCAVLVAGAAVALRERQEVNAEIDRQKNVLMAAGEMRPDEALSAAEVAERFSSFQPMAVNLNTDQEDPSFNVVGYDQRGALGSPQTSFAAPAGNLAQIQRLPNDAVVYKKVEADGTLDMIVLPIEGKGLWSTMYGFLALDADLKTIRGLTFYQHGETPGLGGEVDNPRWKALWPGRLAFNDRGVPTIAVRKGPAGPPAEDPYNVDGLSGATLTSRGVTNLLHFWLGDEGYGPYLEKVREHAGA